jgi:hypothetical protein
MKKHKKHFFGNAVKDGITFNRFLDVYVWLILAVVIDADNLMFTIIALAPKSLAPYMSASVTRGVGVTVTEHYSRWLSTMTASFRESSFVDHATNFYNARFTFKLTAQCWKNEVETY